MSSSIPSNIHVFVTFKEDAIFAGETLDAIITFRNVDVPRQTVAAAPNVSRDLPVRQPSRTSQTPSRPTLSRATSVSSQQAPRLPGKKRPGHKPNLSLQIDRTAVKTHANNLLNGAPSEPRSAGVGRSSGHGRSVSIVSMGNEAGDDKNWGTQLTRVPSRPGKHSRSSSLQVTPVLRSLSRTPSINDARSPRWRSSTYAATPLRYQSAESYFASSTRNSGLGISTNGVTSPFGEISPSTSRNLDNFEFPPSSSPQKDLQTPRPDAPKRTRSSPLSPPKRPLPFRPLSPRISEDKRSDTSHASIAKNNRTTSLVSDDVTPRSSTDVYSMSNGSDETMDSEYAPQTSHRFPFRPPFMRTPSNLGPNAKPKQPETLMMGYAHITGSFMLDGSLANQAPFEEVKRRAVVGGQAGGGVVGVEQRKQSTGFFGALGWGSIGESIGGLLQGGEMSSIREMKGIANSDDIPLISTPKSILFVDLTLAPGESRSYSYAITLPRGLPPSHKGRAMKVSYNLVIGTQRPQSSGLRKQPIRHAEIPFRVFGNVNTKGEDLGHDLMTPYTILLDRARTSLLEPDSSGNLKAQPAKPATFTAQESAAGEAEFQTYVNDLMTRPRRSSTSSAGILSPSVAADLDSLSPITPTPSNPTGAPTPFSFRNVPQPSPRALVDIAIQRSTQPLPLQPSQSSSSPLPSTTSPTHFTIARAGSPIATLILSRPFLRLGDTLHFALDFSLAATPCYAVDVALESVESVDPSLALRSDSSIERATRRVWDRAANPALAWSTRWASALKVPWSATPTFLTTGVACAWAVRIEITVAPYEHLNDDDDDENDDIEEPETEADAKSPTDPSPSIPQIRHRTWHRPRRLLRQASADERGETRRAVGALDAESFDIAVPLRVFGAVGAGVTGGGTDDRNSNNNSTTTGGGGGVPI